MQNQIAQLESLKAQLESMRTLNISLNASLKSKDTEIERLRKQVADLTLSHQSLLNTVNEFLINSARIFDLIEKRVNAIAVSERAKRNDFKGVKYREDVFTTSLINDYTSNGFKITKSMCEKYKMTYQGIRDRLIKSQVYKQRQ